VPSHIHGFVRVAGDMQDIHSVLAEAGRRRPGLALSDLKRSISLAKIYHSTLQ